MKKMIWFDMDGTIANLYNVANWLDMLIAELPNPYEEAEPMLNMSVLARQLNALKRKGWQIGIISWLSKHSTPQYDKAVTAAKINWLNKHLKSVKFDKIHIVPYGTNKTKVCGGGILFDDEEGNRARWDNGIAFLPQEITKVLHRLNKDAVA